MKTVTIATRPTALALAQTNIVAAKLKGLHRGVDIKILNVSSSGDLDNRTALWNLKDTGFFTSRLEQTLAENQADIAVHSYKDLPTVSHPELTIAAVFDRSFPEDCLISAEHVGCLSEMKPTSVIGTSSLRRAVQIKKLLPLCRVEPIRGKVETRIAKLGGGVYDAIILARAGLERLNLSEKISVVFEVEKFLPAPAQGSLAIQARKSDRDTIGLLSVLENPDLRIETEAERQVLVTTECGCHAPVGAFAKIVSNDIIIEAFIADSKGQTMVRDSIKGPKIKALELAKNLAERMLDKGGKGLREDIKK